MSKSMSNCVTEDAFETIKVLTLIVAILQPLSHEKYVCDRTLS